MPTQIKTRRDRKAAKREQYPPGVPSIEGHKNRERPNGEWHSNDMKQPEKKPVHWTSRVEACCAMLLVFITAYYAFWAKKQATASEKALTISQRPWVGPSLGKTVINKLVDGQQPTWLVYYKNYGNSPALHVHWKTRLRLLPLEQIDWRLIQSDIETLPIETPDVTLFNGDRLPNPGNVPFTLPPGVADDIVARRSYAILGGRIQYQDEFGERLHETTFCLYYTEDAGEPTWNTCPVNPMAD